MIITDRLVLRPFSKKDAKELVSAVNHKDIARHTRIPHPYGLSDANSFIKSMQKEMREKRSFAIGIFLDDEIIGGIGLHQINWQDSRAEFGYWLTPKAWGKGYAREACYGFLSHVFHVMHLHRVEIEVKPANTRSIRLIRWIGAKKEGVLRSRCCSQDCHHDVYLFGLLREDFEKLDEKGRYTKAIK